MRLFKNLSSAPHHEPDYTITFITFVLVIFGLVMLTSASSDLGQVKFGDSYYYLKHQILYGLSIGLVGFWLTSKIYYRRYQNWAPIIFFISLVFLILVFTKFGVSSGGATRWVGLGSLSFQPSELLKIAFILYLASWLNNRSKQRNNLISGLLPFLLLLGVVSLLLILQPSTSSAAILVGTALVMYFVSGAKISHIILTIFLGLAAFLLIAYLTPYRWERITSFLQPGENIKTSSYQLDQAQIAIGSGGVTGVGFGRSTTKLHYLPQPIDDSIFAIIGEELGFIGSSALILLFITLSLRTFLLAKKIGDGFGKLILIGSGTLIAIQTFLHIGSISGLIPLTGVPLPYISYGGTALAVFMTISGIMVNISKYS